MKNIFIITIIVAFQSIWGFTYASTLILEEIQKSITKDFKLQGKIKVVEEKIPDQTLSKGESIVAEQLRLNREKIKELNKRKQEQLSQSPGTDWQEEKLKEISDWQKEKQDIINNWIIEKKKFNKRIPEYKKNLISEKDFKVGVNNIVINKEASIDKRPSGDEITPININIPVFPDFYVIDKALDVEIKDQGNRPTCAAFTGVRAVEILLSQQGKNDKLSEQYFFWASLPKCQSARCGKIGSWVYNAYQTSLESKSPNIPLDQNCPYNEKSEDENVTQIPLPKGCTEGFAKVKKFSNVLTSAEIINAIKSGYPVIGGFKLSDNFYKNNGYVFQQNVKPNELKIDEHAAGHAVLLVGLMKLPPELHQKEGKFCLISANSWGPGWGIGGHSCVSERWINEHRFNVPFVALEAVETI